MPAAFENHAPRLMSVHESCHDGQEKATNTPSRKPQTPTFLYNKYQLCVRELRVSKHKS